jgi:hypothetical protein
MRLNLDLAAAPAPGATFPEINALGHSGATPPLSTVVEDFLTDLVPLYTSAVTFALVELWEYVAGTFDANFISAYEPTADVGTGTGTLQTAGQAILTFRTAGGGIVKLSLMESLIVPGLSSAFPSAVVAANTLATEFLTFARPWLGRDNTRPLVAKGFFPGTNEALWKKYFR